MNLRISTLPPLPEMYTMYTDYSFSREGVGKKMCTMCTDYSFSCEGVGQQDVYSLCTVYSFFSARYLANPKEKVRGGE